MIELGPNSDKKYFYWCSCEGGQCFLATNTPFLPDRCLSSSLPKGSWSVDEDMKNPFVTVKPVEINYTNPTRISEINWGKRSVRIINELTAHNINNLGELLNLSRSDVLMFKNIGRVALMCIVDTLAEMNLQLKEEINV